MSKAPLWTAPFIALAFINFFTFFCFQLLLPVFPVHLSSLGNDKQTIGLVMASFTVAVIPMRIIASQWLEKGMTRFCIVTGIIVMSLATIGYWLASNIEYIRLARMLHGVGFGISTVTYGTLVSILVPAERRAEGMGYFGLSVSIAMCLGPWAGPWVHQEYGFIGVVVLSVACVLIALPIVFLIPPGASKVAHRKPFSLRKMVVKEVFFPTLLCVLLGITWGGIAGYVALWGKELNVENIGTFFLINALCSVLVRLGTGRLADRFGYSFVIIPSMISLACGYYLLAIAGDYSKLKIAAVFVGIGFGILSPTFQAWTINLAPPDQRSAAIAMYYNCYDIGIGSGIALWGTFSHYYGFPNLYYTTTFLTIIMFILYTGHLIIRKLRKVPSA